MTNHPAKFNDVILDRVTELLDAWGWPERVLDPFAGVGRVHGLTLRSGLSVGVELEPEWSTMHPRNIVANTLALPFRRDTFDGMITSPCYGNRMADHHNAKERCKKCKTTGVVGDDLCPSCGGVGYRQYLRMTYRHQLGRALHPDNSGQLQWGPRYREFHERAWTEVLRVLTPGALIVLNVSNHLRGDVEQPVSEWHRDWFTDHQCDLVDSDEVVTRRFKRGENHEKRVSAENIFVFRYTPEFRYAPPERMCR